MATETVTSKFINNRPYPIGVSEPSGARRIIRPGGIIEGDWYARFVGPKSLAVYRDGTGKQTQQAVEMSKAFGTSTTRDNPKMYMTMTAEQWIAKIALPDFGEELAKGQLLGLASHMGVRTTDDMGKGELIGAIKAHFGA